MTTSRWEALGALAKSFRRQPSPKTILHMGRRLLVRSRQPRLRRRAVRS